MGLGNRNSNHANKGSNYNFEHRVLLLLGETIKLLSSSDGSETPGTSGTPGSSIVLDRSGLNGDVNGHKAVTFSFPNGPIELDGVILNSEHSPISFSDINGLDSISFDAREITTGVSGGSELIILIIQ